jgi:MoaA/NifB/PqqE/SkfB family radical SAM enzyme
MFYYVNFEISGKCNANFEYCVSGKKSISGSFQQKNSSFIDLERFKSAINYMLKNELIGTDSTVGLYNWGEPFLHPKFKEILSFLNMKGVNYALSTNASKLIEFENFDLKNLKKITFSMPGFSQESYDLIHGFKFERIKSNIKKMLINYR